MNTRFEEKLKVVPEVPKQFGEDGGHFYRYYDTLADEIDGDMVNSLKAQLDGILIFAGLFAGVNSAFLALTLPGMSADPADDTNALLLQFVTKGNGSIHSAEDLPSASFSPASGILPINILFSLSLTFALLAAFLAVLGQQWLVYYRKRSGGGADAQRWEQLRRYLGAKRWRLEAILDDILPSLLQLGLVIFCISFVLYLGTLSRPMCYTVAAPIGLALACIILMAVCAACDNWSEIAWVIVLLPIWGASAVLSKGKQFIVTATRRLGQGAMPANRSSEGGDTSEDGDTGSIISWLAENVPRRAEPVGRLKSMAAKRVICTSEDTNALVYAAINLQAITSPAEARWLLSDDEFDSRLRESWRLVRNGIQSSDPRAVEIVAFSNSLLHLILLSPSVAFIFPPNIRSLVPSDPLDENTSITALDLSRVLWDISWMKVYILGLQAVSSRPHDTHCIIWSLLWALINCYSDVRPDIEMDNWLEQFSTSLVHFREEPPMLTCLLACAVQTYGEPENPRRLPEATWAAVYKLLNTYHKRDALGAIKYALEVFPSVDSPSRPSDGVCVMLLERAPALLKPETSTFGTVGLIAKHAMGLFQNIIHRETGNQLSKHTEKDLVARCINVLVWTFAHAKVSFLPNRFGDFAIDLSSELESCLYSAEQISTRKSSTVDVSAFLNFLRIRDELVSPAKYAEFVQHIASVGCAIEPSSYNSAYDELVTCLARLESAVLAVQGTTDPVMANPADPLPIRLDGRNLPGGKISCYLPM